MSMRTVVVAVLAMLAVGCTEPAPVTPQPSTSSTTTTTTSSPTLTPWSTTTTKVSLSNFPDLTGFRELGMVGYDYGELKSFSDGGYTRFSTPDGLKCQMDGWSGGRGGPPGIVECWGELPGMPGWARAVAASNAVEGRFFGRKQGPEPTGVFKPLPPKSAIRVALFEGDYVMCAVGEAGMTACRLGYADVWAHGFVLSPQGSWTF